MQINPVKIASKPKATPKPTKPAVIKPKLNVGTVKNRSVSQQPIASKPRILQIGDEYYPRQKRIEAIGNIAGCKDKVLKGILMNAEKLFEPKRIIDSGDWLMSHKEPGQTYEDYQKPNAKNTVTKQRSKIYIFAIDPTISEDFLSKLKLYCEAFYTGLTVEIMRPKIDNFLDSLEIPSRLNFFGMQYNANVILKKIYK